jgi:hypothetical protein
MADKDFNTIPDMELDKALLPPADETRVASSNITQKGIDMRSGNLVVRDSENARIMMGKLPDETYGIVITKPGYDVTEVFI